MYSNAQILSAIVNKFAQPIIQQFMMVKFSSMPFVQSIENKVRSTGFVSGNWSLVSEISPMIEPISGAIVQPMLAQYISKIPDAAIPALAHSFVDSMIERGGAELLEGKLILEKSDMLELKKLLNINLPYKKEDIYNVKTEEDERVDNSSTDSGKVDKD